MVGWVGLLGCTIADTLPTKWIHVKKKIRRRSGKVRQPNESKSNHLFQATRHRQIEKQTCRNRQKQTETHSETKRDLTTIDWRSGHWASPPALHSTSKPFSTSRKRTWIVFWSLVLFATAWTLTMLSALVIAWTEKLRYTKRRNYIMLHLQLAGWGERVQRCMCRQLCKY